MAQHNPFIDAILAGREPNVMDFLRGPQSSATPGINPAAPPIPRPAVGPQAKPKSGIEGLLNNKFLLNLLAQSGRSFSPGVSPIGAIGRAGIATQQQNLQEKLFESRIGVNQGAGGRSPFGLVDRAKFTQESVRKFESSGNQSDLVLRKTEPKVSSDQATFEFFESLGDPDNPDVQTTAQKQFIQLQRAAPRPTSVPGGGFGTVDPTTDEFRVSVPEETIRSGIGDRASAGAAGKDAGSQGVLSTAERAVDTAFGETFVAWTQGGEADALKGLSQLKSARTQLDTENISGPGIGNTPAALLAVINPNAADAKAKIEEVVQRNLRLVLGAQFTEKEGERLISRAFDQSLPEEINAERLDRLIAQIEIAIAAKQDQTRYFSENSTLKGWQGKNPTLADFDSALDESPSKVIDFNDLPE